MSGNKNKGILQNPECFSRMNFLLQASQLMAGKNNTLSSYYGQLCRSIGKKAMLRMEPNVKRTFCKRCSLAQLPGKTSDITTGPTHKRRRKRKEPQRAIDDGIDINQACRQCGHERKFIVNTEYKFWLENEESIFASHKIQAENAIITENAQTIKQRQQPESTQPCPAIQNNNKSQQKENKLI